MAKAAWIATALGVLGCQPLLGLDEFDAGDATTAAGGAGQGGTTTAAGGAGGSDVGGGGAGDSTILWSTVIGGPGAQEVTALAHAGERVAVAWTSGSPPQTSLRHYNPENGNPLADTETLAVGVRVDNMVLEGLELYPVGRFTDTLEMGGSSYTHTVASEAGWALERLGMTSLIVVAGAQPGDHAAVTDGVRVGTDFCWSGTFDGQADVLRIAEDAPIESVATLAGTGIDGFVLCSDDEYLVLGDDQSDTVAAIAVAGSDPDALIIGGTFEGSFPTAGGLSENSPNSAGYVAMVRRSQAGPISFVNGCVLDAPDVADTVTDVAIDNGDVVYVAGTTRGNLSFGGQTAVGRGERDAFVATIKLVDLENGSCEGSITSLASSADDGEPRLGVVETAVFASLWAGGDLYVGDNLVPDSAGRSVVVNLNVPTSIRLFGFSPAPTFSGVIPNTVNHALYAGNFVGELVLDRAVTAEQSDGVLLSFAIGQ